jgi:DNA-binding beta-propeller fold protein YncE
MGCSRIANRARVRESKVTAGGFLGVERAMQRKNFLVNYLALSVLAIGIVLAGAAEAQLAISANDGKVKLVDGVVQTVKDGKDTISFIDLKLSPPKTIATIDAPASVVGPPTSVAISPNGTLALVTAAEKIDPTDATKRTWDDKLTVIDLSPLQPSLVSKFTAAVRRSSTPAATPKVLATLVAGKGAAGVSFNKAGTLALVANRAEGTVSIFTVSGTTVTAAGKVSLGDEKSGPSAVSFTPDGKTALVSMDGETAHKIAVLSVDGAKVEYTKRDINAGLKPYGLDVSSKGDVAVVANFGRGQGDNDTVSVIDLKATPPRVASTVTVGQTPEGIKMSPDGKYVAVAVMNGTNKPKASPFYRDNGLLQVYTRNGTQLTKSAEIPVGKWCQGIVWSSNSKTLLVQCMAEEEIQIITFSGITGSALKKTGSIKTVGGPAGIRTSEP